MWKRRGRLKKMEVLSTAEVRFVSQRFSSAGAEEAPQFIFQSAVGDSVGGNSALATSEFVFARVVYLASGETTKQTPEDIPADLLWKCCATQGFESGPGSFGGLIKLYFLLTRVPSRPGRRSRAGAVGSAASAIKVGD